MTPSGYKIRLEKHPGAASWRLIGTVAEGLFCHKPCTVSGGGKSEISKSLRDYMIYGPIFVADSGQGLRPRPADLRPRLLDRWKPGRGARLRGAGAAGRCSARSGRWAASSSCSRPRTTTPTSTTTGWRSFPNYIYPIVFIIKRFAARGDAEPLARHVRRRQHQRLPRARAEGLRPQAGRHLPARRPARLAGWRTFKLRQDFAAAAKVQTEDDITASVVVPGRLAAATAARAARRRATSSRSTASPGCSSGPTTPSIAASTSRPRPTCRGRTTSLQLRAAVHASRPARMVDRVTEFDEFTPPMQQMLRGRGGGRDRLRRLLGQPAARRRQAEQEPALPSDPARPARPVAPLRGRAGHAPGARRPGADSRWPSRSAPCWSAAATTRPTPRPAFAPWPSTARSTTRNCPSCSWTSSAR